MKTSMSNNSANSKKSVSRGRGLPCDNPYSSTLTPLYSAASEYIDKKMSRFHMPGHKGVMPQPFDADAAFDLTEVMGTDSLYEANGAIAELEREYSAIYGSIASFLSAGGSTLCIQAMLSLAMKPGEKIICGRGVHTSAVNTMALLDLSPVWLYPEIECQDMGRGTELMGGISAASVEKALDKNPDAKAVYITSPTYYGVISDVGAISAICHGRGVPLLVDNAHGAHLKFLKQSLHPMDLGADMCADSLHKTLPVLTGGAILHIANERYASGAKRNMALFGSTSPSYLIMLSCDLALTYLRQSVFSDMARIHAETSSLADIASSGGFSLPAGNVDPIRLTLGFWGLGYTSDEFGVYIRSHKIEPEYLGERYCVFLAGSGSTTADFGRLRGMITAISPKKAMPLSSRLFPEPVCEMTLRQAIFAECEMIPADDSAGRIASAAVSPCPPGIPVILPGERITKSMAELFKSYGILNINVVK